MPAPPPGATAHPDHDEERDAREFRLRHEHPDHDEERARRNFRLRSPSEARLHALNRLLRFLADHPNARPRLRDES